MFAHAQTCTIQQEAIAGRSHAPCWICMSSQSFPHEIWTPQNELITSLLWGYIAIAQHKCHNRTSHPLSLHWGLQCWVCHDCDCNCLFHIWSSVQLSQISPVINQLVCLLWFTETSHPQTHTNTHALLRTYLLRSIWEFSMRNTLNHRQDAEPAGVGPTKQTTIVYTVGVTTQTIYSTAKLTMPC